MGDAKHVRSLYSADAGPHRGPPLTTRVGHRAAKAERACKSTMGSASKRSESKEGRRFVYGDNANSSVPTADGSVLYFVNLLIKSSGIVDHEIGRAHPENGLPEVLAGVAGSRVPVARRSLNPVLSPDGQWLTFPLTDGGTSNIWGAADQRAATIAAVYRLRRSRRRDRPPRLVVARQQVSLRRRGGNRCRHRRAGRPARRPPRLSQLRSAPLPPDNVYLCIGSCRVLC